MGIYIEETAGWHTAIKALLITRSYYITINYKKK